MRIILNGRQLHFPYSGTGVYIRNLLTQMSNICPKDSFFVVTNAAEFHKEFPSNVRIVKTKPSTETASIKAQLFWEQITLPYIAKKIDADVVHSPYLGGSCVSFCPQIITVFDIIPFHTALFRRSLRTKIYFGTQSVAIRTARKIITASEYSKNEIVKYFRVPDEKISVIPLAADNAFHVESNKLRVNDIKQKFALAKPFILYAGGASDRKNIETLIDAYTLLGKEITSDYDLVLIGTLDDGNPYHEMLKRRIKGVSFGSVKVIPRISLNELVLFYNAAEVFVYPSHYEGFGLPPLEAMACGTPVIASNSSSIPEVVRDAGLLFDPNVPNELSEHLQLVLRNADIQATMITKGLERAEMFAWRKAAESTLEVYQNLV